MKDIKLNLRGKHIRRIQSHGVNKPLLSPKNPSRQTIEYYGIHAHTLRKLFVPRWRRLVEQGKNAPRTAKHRIVEFRATTAQILTSIINQTPLEGIDLSVQVQDPHFRFRSLAIKEQKRSLQLSEALALTVQRVKTRDTSSAVEKSVQKRVNEADEFAVRLYPVIQNIKSEANVITNKGIVELLNSTGVPTFKKDGKWHTSTLNNLKKRWEDLGIVPTDPTPR